MRHPIPTGFAVFAVAVLAGCAQAPKPAAVAAAAPAGPHGLPAGYLAGQPPIDIMKLLPPPPAPNSVGDRSDRAVYAESAAGIDSPIWAKAKAELDPRSPAVFADFSCATGHKLSPQTTPLTVALLTKVVGDFVPPMETAKNGYARARPYITDRGKACDPVTDDGVGKALGYAYPSGHSGLGWLWALVLSDAAPGRSEPIRAVGLSVGDLRIACRVHWRSDVAHGRTLAAVVYQRVSAMPAYQADVAKAAAEIAKAPPAEGCPA
jgi:acid phosphatase (class A)